MTNDERITLIRDCVLEAQLRGWKIVKGEFVNTSSNTCCPIGALIIIKNPTDHQTDSYISEAITFLEFNSRDNGSDWVWALTEGFDGCNTTKRKSLDEQFALGAGQRLKLEFP